MAVEFRLLGIVERRIAYDAGAAGHPSLPKARPAWNRLATPSRRRTPVMRLRTVSVEMPSWCAIDRKSVV